MISMSKTKQIIIEFILGQKSLLMVTLIQIKFYLIIQLNFNLIKNLILMETLNHKSMDLFGIMKTYFAIL